MVDKQLKKSVREDIYEKIRDDITTGRLMAGERLTEKKLLELYNCSRTPIRESLRQLESEGLISFERNKGIEVSKLSVQQVQEIYDIRELLEGYAVRSSIPKMTKKDIVYLEGLQKKMNKAAQSSDLHEYLQHNAQFHNFFRDTADNENMRQISQILRRRIYRYQGMAIRTARNYEIYAEHHTAIIDACKKKDAAMGEAAMRTHMCTAKEVITESLLARKSLLF